MEITASQTPQGTHILSLQGRLDSRWAAHLSHAVATALRDGAHQIQLDLAAVNFISSAGLRALLQAHKQVRAARGLLHVSAISPEAKSVLELSGLQDLLVAAPATPNNGPLQSFSSNSANWTIQNQPDSPGFTGRLWGQPGQLTKSQPISLPPHSSALGLGSASPGPAGEFLHAAGTLFFLPPDGAGSPDFLRPPLGQSTPLLSPYGASFSGSPSLITRFRKQPQASPVPWTEIITTVGQRLNATRFGLTLLAETTQVVGATLTAPLHPEPDHALSFPKIRDHLSFTTEPAFTRHLALIVAWIEKTARPHPFLRPITPGSPWSAHAHATIFPYRPLPRDPFEPDPYLESLLTEDSPEALLHLLTDSRPAGVGDSTFNHGIVWAAPIATLEGGGS